MIVARALSWWMRLWDTILYSPPAKSRHDGTSKYHARLKRIAAARKRKPQREPFKHYAKSNAIRAFEWQCIQRRCDERVIDGKIYGTGLLSALFKWTYGDKRTAEEALWFGQPPTLGDYVPMIFPFFDMLKKENTFGGDTLNQPVKP